METLWKPVVDVKLTLVPLCQVLVDFFLYGSLEYVHPHRSTTYIAIGSLYG